MTEKSKDEYVADIMREKPYYVRDLLEAMKIDKGVYSYDEITLDEFIGWLKDKRVGWN